MTFRSRSLFLALGLGLGGVLASGAAQARSQTGVQVPTASVLRQAVSATTVDADLLTAARLDFAAADRLYARALLAGDLDAVQARLDALATGTNPAAACRAGVLKAVLQWRDGDASGASETVAVAADRCESADAMLLRARLLDIQGQAGAAASWYQRARALSGDPAERTMIDRRLAVIGVLDRHPEALDVFASQGDALARRRAATVLGLIGRPAGALALYGESGTARTGGADSYAEAVRVADWAISAGAIDAPVQAGRALSAAETEEDRLYALALLVEAYRARDALAGAADDLAARPRDAAIDQTRLDVLLELGRYDDAVALARASDDPVLQTRLIGVLRAAGRSAEVEAEYARLVQAQPAEPGWANALAARHLARGDTDGAADVYRGFLDANRARPQVQIEAARRMIAMGLGDEARRLLGETANAPALAAAVRRLEVEVAIDQGRDAEALAGLAALRADTGRDTALLLEVAEDYERLGRQDLALDTLLAAERAGAGLDDDQRSHIAELAYAAGRPAEALARWQTLWARTELPARKTYLQRLIIRAAKATDQLDPIAASLEQRIRSGAPDEGEVNLLVEIRIAQQDGAGAEQAVHLYAERSQAGEVRTLEQLASVQARLRNYAGLNRTLARLADADPANADAYLRRLVINILRFPDPSESEDARNARVDALLGRIRAAGGQDDAEAARFAASVYTSGFRDAAALVEYRRALALAPADVDVLLEFTAAQKAGGDVEKAVNLLQYKAETASTPAAFSAAVNGLLDVLLSSGADSPPVPADLVQARLAWARRATLDRILRDGDDVRLLSLAGDIGQDRGEPDVRLRALQSSLAIAGDQKPAALRQLVALTSANDDGPGDAALKAIYGRRMVAMRQPYPPEVYADLAGTFLAEGDVAGAERAFGLMGDMGGLVNLEALRGAAYQKVGRPREALASYRLALLQDRNDLDLLARTAVLLEASGARQDAADLYWRAVNLLVQRQPPKVVGEAPPDLDVAQFGPTLIEGLILTWPAAETQYRLADWRSTFQAAVAAAGVGDDAPGTLADAPRLALAVAINHRLAAALGAPTLIAAEAPVAARYGQDPDYRRAAVAIGDVEAWDGSPRDWPINDLARQAEQVGAFDLDLVLAFEAGDHDRVSAMIARAIATDTPWRAARERGTYGAQPAMLVSLLLKAADLASPTVIRQDILPALDATPFRDLALFDVYRVDPERFDKFEAAAGSRLLSDDVLIRLLVTRGNDPLPVAGAAGRARDSVSPLQQLVGRFGVDNLIGLYQALVERMEQTGAVSGLQEPIAALLLDSDLTSGQRDRLQTVLVRDVLAERVGLPNGVSRFAALLLRLDAPEVNRPVLIAGARAAGARFPDGARLPRVLEAWYAGDRDAAFDALSGLIEDTGSGAEDPLQRLASTRFAAERRTAFDAFLARPAPGREDTARFQRRFLAGQVAQESADPRIRIAYDRLAALEPTNPAYVAPLMTLQVRAGDFDDLAATARPFIEARAEDQEAATAVGLALRLAGEAEAAAGVAKAASVDLDDPEWINQLRVRTAARRAPETDILAAFAALWDAYRRVAVDSPVVRALSASGPSPAPVQSGGPQALTPLVAADVSPAQAASLLRGLWRSSSPRGGEPGDMAERQALIDALVDPVAAGYDARLETALTATTELTDEIEDELAALSPRAQGHQMRLYARVAHGILAQGDANGRVADLEARLNGPAISVHDLALYLAFCDVEGRRLSPTASEGLRRQLRAMAAPSPGLRLAAARAMGRSGEGAAAASLVEAALLQTLYPVEGEQPGPGDPDLTPGVFVSALQTIADAGERRRAYESLRTLFDRQGGGQFAAGIGPLPPLGGE